MVLSDEMNKAYPGRTTVKGKFRLNPAQQEVLKAEYRMGGPLHTGQNDETDINSAKQKVIKNFQKRRKVPDRNWQTWGEAFGK